MAALTIYVAGSFKHKHGVRLLGRELRSMGCRMLDWTDKAVPPPGLTPAERRIWMDTDRDGGEVYAFCRHACLTADLVIYYGASGQDAGVEVGLAVGAGVPVLGIRGPLEGPGLMLHGAASAWVDSVEEALDTVAALLAYAESGWQNFEEQANPVLLRLGEKLRAHSWPRER
ncbi:translation initiation factor 2 [Desulfovibrio desulfuricans]|uniref:translation initiation factor 2 n=1 Tax=Desulfovibrio desulfuricans TaxID=876 RepID=UPI001FFCFFEF|nr:translation initiation factor 2 [Desulfovibrio desulfuricans]